MLETHGSRQWACFTPSDNIYIFRTFICESVLFEKHLTQHRHAHWGIPGLALMVARFVYFYVVHHNAFCTRNVDGRTAKEATLSHRYLADTILNTMAFRWSVAVTSSDIAAWTLSTQIYESSPQELPDVWTIKVLKARDHAGVLVAFNSEVLELSVLLPRGLS